MQLTKKKSVSVKDKLEGNELDLSLMELTDVPVKEIATVTRGTSLDLSNNKLVSLPVTFPTLVHIVKLDLSKNHLTSLPPNFGDLRNLKHLDLYSNKLERVPVSFYQLKELRWLDLKNNPLVPTLAEAAGNCLDSKECFDAAKKVVKLMAMVHSELEKKRLREVEEERAREQSKQVVADQEKEQARLQKKAAKEKRKAEAASKQSAPAKSSEIKTIKNELETVTKSKFFNSQSTPKSNKKDQKKNTGSSWFANVLYVMLRLLTLAVVFSTAILALHWQGPPTYDNMLVVSERAYVNVHRRTLEMKEWGQPHVDRIHQQWKQLSRFVAENGRDILDIAWRKMLVWVDTVQERGSEWAAVGKVQAAHYWHLVCQQAPVYYDLALQKVQLVYNSTMALVRR